MLKHLKVNMLNFLKGKKTYILAALAGVTVFCNAVGWIDSGTTATILGLLGAGGLATIRHGINTSIK